MAFPTWVKLALAIWPVAATDTNKADIRAWGLMSETAINALFSSFGMVNGQLDVSVAANVLTIAVKTRAGANASAADPVYVAFRHATQNDGSETIVKLTAALSLVISAGSKVGFVDGEAGRLHIVIFNDGGTLRLGITNCLEGTTIIHPLDEDILQSSTAEGGAGAADSAGVIYTGSAVTSKSMRILGHVAWEANALATAGLYSSAPDTVHLMAPGSHRPGDIVQTRRTVDGELNTHDAGATPTPVDDTIPQLSTEGETQMSRTITPRSRANLLEIDASVQLALSVAGTLVTALHQDSIEDALAVRHADVGASNDSVSMALQHVLKALTQTEKTFKINNGADTGTLSFNGINAARTFGGVNFSSLTVREIFV